jgi:signal transduction histidine kinase
MNPPQDPDSHTPSRWLDSALPPQLRAWADHLLGLRVALPVVLLAMLLTLTANELTYRATHDATSDGIRFNDARLRAAEALQQLTDAETAQRGYLLTGNEDYLAPYHEALKALPDTLAPTLAFIAGSSVDAGAAARDAQRLVADKLAELDATIALRRQGHTLDAVALVESGVGKRTMDSLRRTVAAALDAAAERQQALQRELYRHIEIRRWMIHCLALFATLGLLAYMQRLRADAVSRAREGARLEAEVDARTADLRELASHLQSAREDERARLARELHDELGGLLTAAKLDTARIRAAPDLSPNVRERVQQVSRRLDEVIALKRNIIEDLRPSSLDHLGLAQSLRTLCAEAGERLGVTVVCEVEPLRLSADAELTVYRLVQEALTNVQKYARARRVAVSLSADGSHAHLTVHDDGQGFNVAAAHVGRHGLAGMRYRVEALGGTMRLQSAPGAGTRIEAALPLSATSAAA